MGIGAEIGAAIGNAATGGIPAAVSSLSQLIDNILSRAIPDPIKREEIQAEVNKAKDANDLERLRLIYSVILSQLDINKEEAKSSSWFVAGGRPAIIWVGAVVMFCTGAIPAIVVSIVWTWQCLNTGTISDFPSLDVASIFAIVGSLLGTGWNSTLRSKEKLAGVVN